MALRPIHTAQTNANKQVGSSWPLDRLAAIDGDDGYTGVKPQHRYVTCPLWQRTKRAPNARSCHCYYLYPDYNSRPSKLVATSVTLASFIHPRAVVCVSCTHTEFLSNRSVCIHSAMRNVLLRNTEYVERWYCYLFMYRLYFFT